MTPDEIEAYTERELNRRVHACLFGRVVFESPPYATELPLAWEVVTALASRGWLVKVAAMPPRWPWYVGGDEEMGVRGHPVYRAFACEASFVPDRTNAEARRATIRNAAVERHLELLVTDPREEPR